MTGAARQGIPGEYVAMTTLHSAIHNIKLGRMRYARRCIENAVTHLEDLPERDHRREGGIFRMTTLERFGVHRLSLEQMITECKDLDACDAMADELRVLAKLASQRFTDLERADMAERVIPKLRRKIK